MITPPIRNNHSIPPETSTILICTGFFVAIWGYKDDKNRRSSGAPSYLECHKRISYSGNPRRRR
ncbi:hypothetical protein ASPWEDRAFT_35100 [Aspergillus wentii DTO 134E9]|uniref:Uncharacterized protein n=1 Tax=Aspergillus wentii DTO 134E9 TaxID=1073089 RepID=A0A1L9S2Z6_ASPWE|nr:uncharacterized protein ASPWEDRAFT_35100 [Aspergillus wentii DTO 134E9]OJJ41535.1 hypothetical protein ASPWEDRAFT_35100 [Aspergillus wentii DTO 134E9]